MYIVAFKTNDIISEVAVEDVKNLLALANVLESSKKTFKVYRLGMLMLQEHFGVGGFEFWRNQIN
jgi:hypothetical protein